MSRDYDDKISSELAEDISNYKKEMDKFPNDTVLSRWGMYSHDDRYSDNTASIVKKIEKDMSINNDQAYYMLYYMVSNNIDYDRAKEDMKVDENFEMYKKAKGKRK